MSILIKDVEMPVSCAGCPCANDESRYCYAAKKYIPMLSKPDFCPLSEVEERKTGKWIKLDMHAHLADHKCTACGQECYVPTCMGEPMYAYCPNCGADMRERREE